MAKQLQGSLRFGAVTGGDGGYVSIELIDETSGISFLDIELSYEQFGRLVGSNGGVDCSYTVRGVENIGKKHEHKRGSVKMPASVYQKLTAGVGYDSREKALGQWIKENAKEEGWHIDTYLGAQGSIVGSGYGDEPVTLNFRYYRYVD
jgi:hypothetical protein